MSYISFPPAILYCTTTHNGQHGKGSVKVEMCGCYGVEVGGARDEEGRS